MNTHIKINDKQKNMDTHYLDSFIGSVSDNYEINFQLNNLKCDTRGVSIKFSVMERIPKPAHITDPEIMAGLFNITSGKEYVELMDAINAECTNDLAKSYVLYDQYVSGSKSLLTYWCDEDGDSIMYTDSIDDAKIWTKTDLYKRLCALKDCKRWIPIQLDELLKMSSRVVKAEQFLHIIT